MNKCPECNAETITDYDLNENPYEVCTNQDCSWYATADESKNPEVEDAT